MEPLSEEQLHAFNERKHDALSPVFICYQPDLLYYATGLINNEQTAEEIVSDQLNNVWTRGQRFPSADSLRAHLFVCVRNACLNHLRGSKTVTFIPLDKASELAAADADDKLPYIQAKQLEAIYNQIDHYPDKQKEIMELRYKEGKEPAEIAAMLEMNIQTVYSHLKQGRARLKKHFKNSPILPTLLAFLQLFP